MLGRLDEALRSESEHARLDEREQLAGELHDSVGHSLLATSIQLRNARALWDADNEGAQRSVELASRAVDEALVDTRIAVDTVLIPKVGTAVPRRYPSVPLSGHELQENQRPAERAKARSRIIDDHRISCARRRRGVGVCP